MQSIFIRLIVVCSCLFFPISSSAMELRLDDKSLLASNSISISSDELVFWNSEKTDLNGLLKKLKNQSDTYKISFINLRGDRNVRYEKVIQVIYLIQSVRNININFVVEGLSN